MEGGRRKVNGSQSARRRESCNCDKVVRCSRDGTRIEWAVELYRRHIKVAAFTLIVLLEFELPSCRVPSYVGRCCILCLCSNRMLVTRAESQSSRLASPWG